MFDRAFHRLVTSDDVVAVNDFAGDSVTGSFVNQVFRHALKPLRRRIRITVAFHHDDHGQFLHGGEIDAFVKRAGRSRAVADIRDADARRSFFFHPRRQQNSRQNRNHIAQMRNRTDETALNIGKVKLQIGRARRRVGARHILRENLARQYAFDKTRADVSNQRRDKILLFERESRPDRGRFLSERRKNAARELALPLHRHGFFVKHSGQFQKPIKFEHLPGVERGFVCAGKRLAAVALRLFGLFGGGFNVCFCHFRFCSAVLPAQQEFSNSEQANQKPKEFDDKCGEIKTKNERNDNQRRARRIQARIRQSVAFKAFGLQQNIRADNQDCADRSDQIEPGVIHKSRLRSPSARGAWRGKTFDLQFGRKPGDQTVCADRPNRVFARRLHGVVIFFIKIRPRSARVARNVRAVRADGD